MTYAEVKWEHKIDVSFDRRLLYRTADLRSKKLIGDRQFSTDLSWVVELGYLYSSDCPKPRTMSGYSLMREMAA